MKLEHHFKLYSTSLTGLSEVQVIKNKERFGINKIVTQKRESFLHILLLQLGSFFSVVLFSAATILLLLGDFIEFYTVLTIIIVNSVIESIQRHKSDSIFESLTKMLPVYSIVIRDGQKKHIASSEITLGDILVLQAGDQVPVDGLVVLAEDFKVDEAVLTGESRPVTKIISEDYKTDSIIDNSSMVFSGSYVTTGNAHVLVSQIGNQTQIGLIAQKVSTIDTQLPIYKNIKRLSTHLFIGIIFIALFVLLIGISREGSVIEILKLTVALCVSAIPESLPVTITLILAYGFKRMGEKNVLVKKMQSLDVLGQIDTLALDKTGTITRNQMKVEKIYTLNGPELYVAGDGYEPVGKFLHQGKVVSLSDFPTVTNLVKSALLSSTGSFMFDEDKKEWVLEMGDPTEVSLLVLAQKSGITREHFSSEYILQKNIPFSNEKMYHSVIYKKQNKTLKMYTGAPEVIFTMSTHAQVGDVFRKINDTYTGIFKSKIKEYSSQGYRILATCVEDNDKTVFLGVFAINDSIRLDVVESVLNVYGQNIDIIIITGDHKDIALQVAQKIGLRVDKNSVLTGNDMTNLTDVQIKNIILQKKVFARVTPQQKLKILELLKELGRTVAMTGDGVNDSLALVKADIGIAMGTLSSESAKAAADIVLLDNKFGSIVYGVEEGRSIFSNIKKTIIFLLSTNFAEMFVTVFAILLMLPLPFSAAGILWVNFVTDTFLAIGFAFERGLTEKNKKNILVSITDWYRIFYLGIVMTLISLFVFVSNQTSTDMHAQGMVLLVLIMMQWFNVLNIRAGNVSIFKYGFKINKMFIVGWLISASLTVFAFSSEFMRSILKIDQISTSDVIYLVFLASLIIVFEEIRKLFLRK